MKTRLEKPAVNFSNLTGGKSEKARRGAFTFVFRLDLLRVFAVSLYIYIQTSFLVIMMSLL